jgi:hypothetical protein
MHNKRRVTTVVALAAIGALAAVGVAFGAATSTFTFSFAPNQVPKNTFKAGSLRSNLLTSYTNPGNSNPGGAVERTQLFLDKNWKINPKAAAKCSPSQLANKTMKAAMAACKRARVGLGRATASANGAFTINGCVLLFNGQPRNGRPTLLVFTRVQASNPSTITCDSPATNTQGNATILLTGVLKDASGKYGKVLDVNHITQAATFPLQAFNTKIQKGSYISARCAAADKLWHMQVTWTYNNGAKHTEAHTQSCRILR